MTSCLDMSTSAFIKCPHTPPRVPPVPAADACACAPPSPALRNNNSNNKADDERRKLLLCAADEQQPQEEEDSRSFHRRNLKRKQSEQGDGTGRSASGGDRRNVRRKRRERTASLKADDNEAQDLRSEEGTGNNKKVARSFQAVPVPADADGAAERPAQILEVFSGKNNEEGTPSPDAKATVLASATPRARAGLEGGGCDPHLEDCAGGNNNNSNARRIPLPPRQQLQEDPVKKLVVAPSEKPLVPVAGERAPFRRAPLSADDDDSGEDDADPNRPCRMIQFVSVTDRRQLMQALHCNNATAAGGGAGAGAGGPRHPSSSPPLHQRWREEVGLAAATRYGVRDGPLLVSGVVAKKRWSDYGSCSSSSDDDDDGDSTTSSNSTDYSTSSSSTASSHDCDGSSVESDLTTDPRLFALSTSAVAARMSASAASDADHGDRYRYALDANGEDYDAHGENVGRHYRLNLPPEVAWKALIVLSIFVILLDLIYSTVADVVVRVVNRARRKNRARP
jgi:hypothetical protein